MKKLLSALDPVLLLYNADDFWSSESDCFDRLNSLTMHCGINRTYNQSFAISYDLISLISNVFPWAEVYRRPELSDLRHFIYEDLQKAEYIDCLVPKEKETDLNITSLPCIKFNDILQEWKKLLFSMNDDIYLEIYRPQVATWKSSSTLTHENSIYVSLIDSKLKIPIQSYCLPLVWDYMSWANQLLTQEWWPDLQRCVELHYLANPTMQSYPGVREQPIPFTYTETFMKSAERHCEDKNIRISLIEALAKKVYGINDPGLQDKQLHIGYSFRVGIRYRVLYIMENDTLTLQNFGPREGIYKNI